MSGGVLQGMSSNQPKATLHGTVGNETVSALMQSLGPIMDQVPLSAIGGANVANNPTISALLGPMMDSLGRGGVSAAGVNAVGANDPMVASLVQNLGPLVDQMAQGGGTANVAGFPVTQDAMNQMMKQLAPMMGLQVGPGAPDSQALLWAASQQGDCGEISKLLDGGGDVNKRATTPHPSGCTYLVSPLFEAVASNQERAARMLIERGANVDLANSDGTAPLMEAAASGFLDLLRLLLERGADIDLCNPNSGDTALHSACRHNQPDCAEVLVLRGCDTTLRSKQGWTAEDYARDCGHTEVLQRLQYTASPLTQGARLLKAVQKGDCTEIDKLLAGGADINELVSLPNSSGGESPQETPLIKAVSAQSEPATKLLIQRGADVNAPSKRGDTPLMRGAALSCLPILSLLLESGARVDTPHPESKRTAFHFACLAGQADNVELLLVQGNCNKGLSDVAGKTGRDCAEDEGQTAVVERLASLKKREANRKKKLLKRRSQEAQRQKDEEQMQQQQAEEGKRLAAAAAEAERLSAMAEPESAPEPTPVPEELKPTSAHAVGATAPEPQPEREPPVSNNHNNPKIPPPPPASPKDPSPATGGGNADAAPGRTSSDPFELMLREIGGGLEERCVDLSCPPFHLFTEY